MRYRFLRYPEGKTKAVTFSYDDGVRADIRLAEVCNRHGMKCTFNINSSRIAEESGGYKLSVEEIQKYLLDAGHEVAVHGYNHNAPGLSSPINTVQDVLNCRLDLEKLFGRIIRGLAYPDSGINNYQCGTDYPTTRTILQHLDIAYARTLGGDNNKFRLPEDWYAWMPTVHHKNPQTLDYAEEFVSFDVNSQYVARRYPLLFYVWGHSYEFDNNNNWELLEELCQKLGDHEDTWYATNIDICDYVHAYESLVFSADNTRVYNPTLYKIWFEQDTVLYSIAPGETLVIQ